MVVKQNKRPFNGDDSCQLSCKHPRQLDFISDHLVSFMGIYSDIPEKTHPSVGEGEGFMIKSLGKERLVNYTITELSVAGDKGSDISSFGSVSSLSWVTSSSSEEDPRSEPALHISCSPSFLNHDSPSRTLMQSEDIHSPRFECPPQIHVPIGPDYQADIPLWGLHDTKNWEKFMGTCIIPRPNVDSSALDDRDVGRGRIDCWCLDCSSVRCVRQHVIEAREKLKGMLGQERFMELGFCNMGEDVAGKWSEEEERLFHEIVFSNPESLGQNFWDLLSLAFPSKTKKDLVSYYFNVFMLRRRAEQNRSDPINVDSDDDECNGDAHEDYHDDDDISESQTNKKPSSGRPFNSSHPIAQLMGNNNRRNGLVAHDIQDDSCSSDENEHSGSDSYGPADVAATHESRIKTDHKHLNNEFRNYSLGGVVDHGYILEPCDAKFWDARFLTTGPLEDVFLPTWNVIQEVFGEEAWNNNGSRNDPSIS
ncbi:uncharacterized protein LOC143846766 [Tasmannia lanceolata]|uniref:uncharacterized protein LOC143846766 n=1 Tax=Tasmannia lanceolata TaxID=3420 RepID=UPI004063B1CB